MARRCIVKEVLEERAREQHLGKRKENIRQQRLVIILACEGAKTERLYFEAWFAKLKGSGTLSAQSCVIAPHNCTHPTGVLDDLLSYKSSSGITYAQFEHRWIVIDRDEEQAGGGHTLKDFNKALISARKNDPSVEVAWSNPCFEIWFLLHFKYHVTGIDRDSAFKALQEACPHGYTKNNPSMYELLAGEPLKAALQNATRLEQLRIEQKLPEAKANPGTTVYQLVSLLMSYLEPSDIAEAIR